MGRLANSTRAPSLWLGASGRSRLESSREHANSCRLVRLMRATSASQNLQSNEALCATRGISPTKSDTSRMTLAAVGAWRIIAFEIPVSASMNEGMRTPAFIKLWYRSTTLPFSRMTAAISVARSPCAGDKPVVSKSITATTSKIHSPGVSIRNSLARIVSFANVSRTCL